MSSHTCSSCTYYSCGECSVLSLSGDRLRIRDDGEVRFRPFPNFCCVYFSCRPTLHFVAGQKIVYQGREYTFVEGCTRVQDNAGLSYDLEYV